MSEFLSVAVAVALFASAMVIGRMAAEGRLHGLLVWILSASGFLHLVGRFLSLLTGWLSA